MEQVATVIGWFVIYACAIAFAMLVGSVLGWLIVTPIRLLQGREPLPFRSVFEPFEGGR